MIESASQRVAMCNDVDHEQPPLVMRRFYSPPRRGLDVPAGATRRALHSRSADVSDDTDRFTAAEPFVSASIRFGISWWCGPVLRRSRTSFARGYPVLRR